MALALQDFTTGQTDYIARLNENNTAIEEAVNALDEGAGATGDYIPTSEKGAASGVATLTAGSVLTGSQVPDLSGTYKILAYAEPVMFPIFVPKKLDDDSQLLLSIKPAFPITIAVALAGTTVQVETANPAATATFTLYKNGASFGTVAIATDGTPTLTSAAGASFNGTTDVFKVIGPSTKDTTLSGFGITVKGTK